MGHRRRRRHRQAMIDAAMLLGWTIVRRKEARKGDPYLFELIPPCGGRLVNKAFQAAWIAAHVALQQSGVDVQALDPGRQT